MKQYQADCPWTENKEVFWVTSSVSSAWNFDCNLESINIWRKCQFSWSGKVYIWLWQPVVSTSSCMLRIEKLITFNMTCMWTFHTLQIHSCMGICFSCMYTNNCEHFHKWFGTLYRDNSVLMRVPHNYSIIVSHDHFQSSPQLHPIMTSLHVISILLYVIMFAPYCHKQLVMYYNKCKHSYCCTVVHLTITLFL